MGEPLKPELWKVVIMSDEKNLGAATEENLFDSDPVSAEQAKAAAERQEEEQSGEPTEEGKEQTPEEVAAAEKQQVEEQHKALQRQHQGFVEFAKANNPELVDTWKAIQSGDIEAAPEPEPVEVEEAEATGDEYMDTINKGFADMAKRFDERLDARDKAEKDRRGVSLLKSEQDNIADALKSWVDQNKIPQEVVTAAIEQATTAASWDQLGGPTRQAEYATLVMQNQMLMKHIQSQGAGIVQDSEGRVDAANLVAQPLPGALPSAEEQTRNAKIVEEVQNTGDKNRFSDLMRDK